MDPKKINVINILKLISDIDEQDKYNQNVPIANVASELVNQWFDDFFHPDSDYFKAAFSDSEWDILMEFHNYYDERVADLPSNYEKLRNNPIWREIVGKANWALDELGWKDTKEYKGGIMNHPGVHGSVNIRTYMDAPQKSK